MHKSYCKYNRKERKSIMNKNEKERINYLAIAITTNCNYKCFYCKPTGENIQTNLKGTINYESIKKIIKVAYELGITIFRITGGEPTMVEYLPELINYIMNLGENTKIRLNTNGYKLNNILDIIEHYKERIDIVISVDSVNEYIHGIQYPKYLSPEIKKITKELIKRKIETRFNIVVTKQNIEEINELIEKSFSLGVNIKILDLIIRDDYYGIKHQITGEEALKFGKDSYVSLEGVTSYLALSFVLPPPAANTSVAFAPITATFLYCAGSSGSISLEFFNNTNDSSAISLAALVWAGIASLAAIPVVS